MLRKERKRDDILLPLMNSEEHEQCGSKRQSCDVVQVMDEEESKKLKHFTEIGVKAFYEAIQDLKKNKVKSKATPSNKKRLMNWLKGGAGCVPIVGSVLKSAVDEIWATSDQAKYEKERAVILTWTDSNSNEKIFLSAIAEGMAYICIAFKDQLKTVPKNDLNDEIFAAEVVRRVLNFLKEKPPGIGKILDSKMFYNAFINGRSTPKKIGKQVKSKFKTKNAKKVARGMDFVGGQNTWDIFENTGVIISNKADGYDFMVMSVNTTEEIPFESKNFRVMFPFESKDNLGEFKIIQISQPGDVGVKDDWRFRQEIFEESVAVVKKISLPTSLTTKVVDKLEENFIKQKEQTNIEMMPLASEPSSTIGKWWPQEKKPIQSFFERKSENELLTSKLHGLLLENQNANKRVVVIGLAGIGKSTLVKRFSQEFQNDYAHIFWIQSDKGILLKSFQNLARDIILKNRLEIEFDQKLLATNIYKHVHTSKCLFIFDNAECYRSEFGIQDVLPNHENLHVIITSRNTDWGNSCGDGEIPPLKMTVFEINDSIAFFKQNITQNVAKENEGKLETLCNLLGNLPLALQIALAYINREEPENYQDYINIIKSTAHILVANNTDDYEKTIFATMQISLDIIKNHTRDELGVAYKMLTIFSYITPDDVPSEFFISVLAKQPEEKKTYFSKFNDMFSTCSHVENIVPINKAHVSDAITLLESYSLITPTKTTEAILKLSIHRLLQQAIRHKEKESQDITVKQIMKCQGFLDYKLIPFTTYASSKIVRKFPTLKAEFIQKLELNTFLKERKFHDAVELSRIIKESMKNETSLFNFAVCLKHNGESDEAKKILKHVLGKVKGSEFSFDQVNFNEFGIVDLKQTLTKQVVAGQLFLIHLNQLVSEKAEKLIRESKGIIFPMSKTSLNGFIRNVDRYFLSGLAKYSLVYDEEWKYCFLHLDREQEDALLKRFEMHCCKVDENNIFPQDLQELCLEEVELFALNQTFALQKLTINSNRIEMKDSVTIPNIHLENVQILHGNDSEWISNSAVIEMRFDHSTLNISVLPLSLQKLTVDTSILENCFLSSVDTHDSCTFPLGIKDLEIRDIKMYDKNEEKLKLLDISPFLPQRLDQFKLRDCFFTRVFVSLVSLQYIPNLHLCDCSLIINPNTFLHAKQLFMRNVTFVGEKSQEEFSDIPADSFIDFDQLQNLELRSNKGISLDLSERTNVNDVTLYETKVVNWDKKKWNSNIKKLEIYPDPDQKEDSKCRRLCRKCCCCR